MYQYITKNGVVVAQGLQGGLGESGVISDICITEEENMVNKKSFLIGEFSVRGGGCKGRGVSEGSHKDVVNGRGAFACGTVGVKVPHWKNGTIEKSLQLLAERYQLKSLGQGCCGIRKGRVAETEMGVHSCEKLVSFFMTENSPYHSAKR